MNRLSRLALSLAALVLLAPQAHAQLSPTPFFAWQSLAMRNTTAANNVARDANWAHYGPAMSAASAGAFTDSITFAHALGGATNVNIDTTCAYPVALWPLPGTFAYRNPDAVKLVTRTSSDNGQHGPAGTDSLVSFSADTTDRTPWIIVRVRQDTVSNGGTTVAAITDSIGVGAQWSPDGIRWFSVATASRRFWVQSTNVGGVAEDYVATAYVLGVERSPDMDVASVSLRCFPALYDNTTDFIEDQTLCMCNGYVRFLIALSNDTGQGTFAVDVGHWANQ